MANARQFMAARTAAWAKSGGRPYLDLLGDIRANTGYVIPQDMVTIKSEIEMVCRQVIPMNVFFSRGSSGNPSSYLFTFETNYRRIWYGFGAQLLASYDLPTNALLHIVADETALNINNVEVVGTGTHFPTYAGTPMWLFSWNGGASDIDIRWYGHRLTVNGVVVRDWVPFSDGGVAKIKDLITGGVVTLIGSGNATYGEDAA